MELIPLGYSACDKEVSNSSFMKSGGPEKIIYLLAFSHERQVLGLWISRFWTSPHMT